MKITKGETTVNVPSWVLVLGVLALDNAIANICKVKIVKSDNQKKGS